MKAHKSKNRKLKRIKNRNRINRLRNQQVLLMAPIFILVLIKLALPYGSPKKTLARLRLHIEKLTGNAFFPLTAPTIAVLTAMADELDDTITKIEAGLKSLIPHRDTLVADSLQMIRDLAYNIQDLSKGDEEMIKSAGFDVRKIGGAIVLPAQVQNFKAKPIGPGKIKLSWTTVDNAAIYIIEQLIGANVPPLPGPAHWDAIGKTRNVSFVVEGLNPGELYYFRAYATIGKSDGNPSDPAEQRSL